MIRIVIVVLAAVVVWALLVWIIRQMKRGDIDWKGIGVIAAFIALAFWLRHVAGMG
ncbi:hypothetical protein [Mesorhizobium sp. BE184]|uniref:hypothetical protein n=1 Tax=Mesorhizobium sp. BE184 TaxID=2817714 RepID=UPI00285911A4|nr:hypothetical protein [Mesorhizobium sp. BE184]MDR7032018.1 protein-S-isoprenylcysteine O-methyltransferase Ste14 [Mesorhizobium sp. BE184]